jgi:hypothetical protein
MTTLLKPISIWALIGVVTLIASSTIAGQGQAPPPEQGRGRAAGPPPPFINLVSQIAIVE